MWTWCVHTFQLSQWGVTAFCFISTRGLGSTGPCPGIYIIVWHSVAVSSLGWPLPFLVVAWCPIWEYSVLVELMKNFAAFILNPACLSLMNTCLSFKRWSSRLPFVLHKRFSMYAQMNSKVTISSDILAQNMSGEHELSIGSHREEYFLHHRKIMVHMLDKSGSNLMV